jgi:hypothetical protein
MEAENMTSPLLKTALAGLSLDLEQELKRYRHDQEVNFPDQLAPDQLAIVNQDSDLITGINSDLSFNSVLDLTSDDAIPDIDTQDWELSYLFDDLSSDLSTDLENALEEEFQDQVLTREFAETSTEISSVQVDQNSEESAPNLLSPIGIIAMIILLISSATVGYLWVDPSGLNRLIKSDPNSKPTSSLPARSINQSINQVELFQTRDRKEPIPFMDFSISKPSNQRLSKIISPFISPIGLGRSLEQPIRVEPEAKIKLEPVVTKPKPKLPQPSEMEKADLNSKLDPEPTLSSPEITPNSALNTPSTPNSTPNLVDGNISLDATRLNPIGERIDATKPTPSVDPQVKPEVTQEAN